LVPEPAGCVLSTTPAEAFFHRHISSSNNNATMKAEYTNDRFAPQKRSFNN
jgi:hypothetical protein